MRNQSVSNRGIFLFGFCLFGFICFGVLTLTCGLGLLNTINCTQWETRWVDQTDCVEIVEGMETCSTRKVEEPVCVSWE